MKMENNSDIYLFMQNRARACVCVWISSVYARTRLQCRARMLIHLFIKLKCFTCLCQSAVASLCPFHSFWLENLAEFSCFSQTADDSKTKSGNGLAQVHGLGVDIESPPLIVKCMKIISIYRIDSGRNATIRISTCHEWVCAGDSSAENIYIK